jgi:hypothetical protein
MENLAGVTLTTRTFNLHVREQEIDRKESTMRLGVYSDEGLLLDYLWLGPAANTEAEAYQASLRAIVNNVVLDKIGAVLEPGDTDATYIPLDDRTNLILNPSIEVNTANWGGGGVVLTRATHIKPPIPGVGTIKIATTASRAAIGAFACQTATYLPTTPGRPYTFSCYLTSPYAKTMRGRVRIRWLTAANATLTESMGAYVSLPLGKWTRLTVTGVAPPSAERMGPIVEFATMSGVFPAGGYFYADGASLVEGPSTGYFDGNTPDTEDYSYAWEGTAHASASIRTALVSRPAELLQWEPGESGSDFLDPLLTAAGLRLFCDEQQRWWLVDQTYELDGLIVVAAEFNAVEGSETVSRNNAEGWADAVIVKYEWRDKTTTAQRVKYDMASLEDWTKAKLVEYARPYAGQGAAQYLLDRAQIMGISMQLDAVSDFGAVPNIPIRVELPASVQDGSVSSVEWDMASDEMKLETRNMVPGDIPRTYYVNTFETGLPVGTELLTENSGGPAGDPLTIWQAGESSFVTAAGAWHDALAGLMTLEDDGLQMSAELGADDVPFSLPVFAWQAFIRLDASFPSTTQFLWLTTPEYVPVMSVQITADRLLSTLDRNGLNPSAFTPATPLALGTWYRFDGWVNAGAGTSRIDIHVGDTTGTGFATNARSGTDYGSDTPTRLIVGRPLL